MLRRFIVEVVEHDRRIRNKLLHVRILAVQNTQRVLLEAANTIFIQLRFHGREVIDERFTIFSAGFQGSQRIQLEHQAG